MDQISIITEKEQFTDAQIRSIEHVVVQNYKSFIDKATLKIEWNQFPKENAYHNFKHQVPSIISFDGNKKISEFHKLQFSKRLTEDWMAITKQPATDIFILLIDENLSSTIFKISKKFKAKNRRRRLLYKIKHKLGLLS